MESGDRGRVREGAEGEGGMGMRGKREGRSWGKREWAVGVETGRSAGCWGGKWIGVGRRKGEGVGRGERRGVTHTKPKLMRLYWLLQTRRHRSPFIRLFVKVEIPRALNGFPESRDEMALQ